MIIHTDFSGFSSLKHPVVTIGTFDGVHPGHRSIIERLKQIAAEKNGETVLLTFYPHPRMVLHPDDHGLQLLSSPEEKAQLLAEAGIQHLMVYPFSADFSRKSAYDYVRDLLVNGLGAKTVVVGYDHRFGKNREGDFHTLNELSEVFGFALEEIPARLIDSIEVSSTKIRHLILEGKIEDANRYLGYSYSFTGKVIRGDGMGRKLGFPTANIDIGYPYKIIPKRGVYKAMVKWRDHMHAAVLNIGIRPTMSSTGREQLEVHLPGFTADLYDETLTVFVTHRLRDEKKFGSVDELIVQIQTDIHTADQL